MEVHDMSLYDKLSRSADAWDLIGAFRSSVRRLGLSGALCIVAACGGGGSDGPADPGVGGAVGGVTVSAPAITTQPASMTVAPSASATFTVVATGNGLGYQWQRSVNGGLTWTNVGVTTQSSYTIAAVDASMNGDQYHVIVQNGLGIVTSEVATLTVTSGSAPPPSTVAGKSLALGLFHTCAIKADRTVACWGSQPTGQLGDGTATQRLTPVSVTGLTDVVSLTAGTSFNCALRRGGDVKCWGNNAFGMLGDGSMRNERREPVSVAGLTDAVAIAAGSGHVCALKANRTVVCWGSNRKGQLGYGGEDDRLTPVAVVGSSDVVAIAAGGESSCALRQGGSVVCWGDNGSSQLGDGTKIDRRTPVAVNALSDASMLATNGVQTCALRVDHTVACWGSDGIVERPAPAAIAGLSDIASIATGTHTCVLRRDGSVACWGVSINGSLGNGTQAGSAVPVPVQGIGTARSIGASVHSCAILADGAAACWGSNRSGQLGDGTIVDRLTPTLVSGGAVFLNE
jgi:alpha-tubulin suppressor-like RCC1 family protein